MLSVMRVLNLPDADDRSSSKQIFGDYYWRLPFFINLMTWVSEMDEVYSVPASLFSDLLYPCVQGTSFHRTNINPWV